MGKKLIDIAALKLRLAERIKRSYFVRFHMFIILSATVISGVICSKILILFGISRMPIRYGIAIILSYLLFFLFVKLWLLYIGVGGRARLKKDKSGSGSWWTDLIPSFRGSASSSGTRRLFTGFGRGASGGGGAGGAFTDTSPKMVVPVGVGADPGVAEGGGGAGSVLEGVLGFGDEGILKLFAILLLAALVFSVVAVGGYLIWSAPSILSEAAFQVLLVTGLSRKVRRVKETGWKISIFKATWWGFLLVLLVSVAFGIVAQLYNPTAVSVRDLFISAR